MVFLRRKKLCDVIQWALEANVMVDEAKKIMTAQYPSTTFTFKFI